MPVAFGGPIDRNGDNRRFVGGDGARQRADGAGDEGAQKTSCRNTLAHGLSPVCPSHIKMDLEFIKVTLD